MLPKLYQQRYQEFVELLARLQQAVTVTEIDAPGLRQSLLEAQKFFQQQIISLDNRDIDSANESRLRSYQTEIDKQLNLLTIDVTFLQAARQPETAETRKMKISQRLETLLGYCHAILKGNQE
jgi:hypothetical protein